MRGIERWTWLVCEAAYQAGFAIEPHAYESRWPTVTEGLADLAALADRHRARGHEVVVVTDRLVRVFDEHQLVAILRLKPHIQ
jgi:hypothetical protein